MPDQPIEKIAVDSFGNLPVFDANETGRYWTINGKLMRDGQLGPEQIGEVLASQTLFWTGPKFGFGFYRAGSLNVAFVFDPKRHSVNDQVKLPRLAGQLIDSTCFFSGEYCWFCLSISEQGKLINRCLVIDSTGNILAQAETQAGDDNWLGTIRGKCAAGKLLFAATDNGLVKVELDNGGLVETKKFPDTEPFVDSNSHVFAGKDGLYIVSGKDITLLKIR